MIIIIVGPRGCSMIRTKGEAGTGNIVEAGRPRYYIISYYIMTYHTIIYYIIV